MREHPHDRTDGAGRLCIESHHPSRIPKLARYWLAKTSPSRLIARAAPHLRPGPLSTSHGYLTTLGIDHLIVIGGDDTLGFRRQVDKLGVKVIPFRKTMGQRCSQHRVLHRFSTAITRASDAISVNGKRSPRMNGIGHFSRLRRDAGFTALYAAYVTSIRCLIPEYKVESRKG